MTQFKISNDQIDRIVNAPADEPRHKRDGTLVAAKVIEPMTQSQATGELRHIVL
jgi:hypothetical protein